MSKKKNPQRVCLYSIVDITNLFPDSRVFPLCGQCQKLPTTLSSKLPPYQSRQYLLKWRPRTELAAITLKPVGWLKKRKPKWHSLPTKEVTWFPPKNIPKKVTAFLKALRYVPFPLRIISFCWTHLDKSFTVPWRNEEAPIQSSIIWPHTVMVCSQVLLCLLGSHGVSICQDILLVHLISLGDILGSFMTYLCGLVPQLIKWIASFSIGKKFWGTHNFNI